MMSDEELYEIAQRRVNQRNLRWTLWSIDLAGLILSLAAIVMLEHTSYAVLSEAVFLAWGGIFTMHTILTALSSRRERSIEREVARLRDEAAVYEKPKRLELSDDGEIVEVENLDSEDHYRDRKAAG